MCFQTGRQLGFLFVALLLSGFIGVLSPATTYAGYPYPHLINKISYDVGEILKKHGMPIRQKWVEENGLSGAAVWPQPWLRSWASIGNYTLELYQADEIPQDAKMEIIRYCMDLYDKRGRKEIFKILMYRETVAEKKPLFSGVKPFFQLTIGGNK